MVAHLHGPNRCGRLFSISTSRFLSAIRGVAAAVGFKHAQHVGTHSFTRGMAQDILDRGGSLAVLMNAGGWASSAYKVYLRSEQVQDTAVGQFLIELSDSDTE